MFTCDIRYKWHLVKCTITLPHTGHNYRQVTNILSFNDIPGYISLDSEFWYIFTLASIRLELRWGAQ
jgi:hypothetical protein